MNNGHFQNRLGAEFRHLASEEWEENRLLRFQRRLQAVYQEKWWKTSTAQQAGETIMDPDEFAKIAKILLKMG